MLHQYGRRLSIQASEDLISSHVQPYSQMLDAIEMFLDQVDESPSLEEAVRIANRILDELRRHLDRQVWQRWQIEGQDYVNHILETRELQREETRRMDAASSLIQNWDDRIFMFAERGPMSLWYFCQWLVDFARTGGTPAGGWPKYLAQFLLLACHPPLGILSQPRPVSDADKERAIPEYREDGRDVLAFAVTHQYWRPIPNGIEEDKTVNVGGVDAFWFYWFALNDDVEDATSQHPRTAPYTGLLKEMRDVFDGTLKCSVQKTKCYALARVLLLGKSPGPDQVTFAWCLAYLKSPITKWGSWDIAYFDKALIKDKNSLQNRIKTLLLSSEHFPAWRETIVNFCRRYNLQRLVDFHYNQLVNLWDELRGLDFLCCPQDMRILFKHSAVNPVILRLGMSLTGLTDFDLHFLSPGTVEAIRLSFPFFRRELGINERRLRIYAISLTSQDFLLEPRAWYSRIALQPFPKNKEVTLDENGEETESFKWAQGSSYQEFYKFCLTMSESHMETIEISLANRVSQSEKLPFRERLPDFPVKYLYPVRGNYEKTKENQAAEDRVVRLAKVRKIVLLATYFPECALVMAYFVSRRMRHLDRLSASELDNIFATMEIVIPPLSLRTVTRPYV